VAVEGKKPPSFRKLACHPPLFDLGADQLHQTGRIGLESENGYLPVPVGFDVEINIDVACPRSPFVRKEEGITINNRRAKINLDFESNGGRPAVELTRILHRLYTALTKEGYS
jgi:hypothetical protein